MIMAQFHCMQVFNLKLWILISFGFHSNVSIEQCRQRGAVLVFTVMDHDYVFQNDFAGEAYVDLCNIPGVDGQDISGFDALAITALPLMQPKHKGNS